MKWSLVVVALSIATLAAQQPQPTFRAGITLVSTDVIPRDKSGRFVSDLTKDNFTILEDGQPQTLSSFTLIQGGRSFNLLSPPPAPSAAPEGLVLPAARPRPTNPDGRVVLVFIDDLHFEPEMSPQVRRIMQQIGDTLLHDGDLVTVISSGPSFIEIGPTYDRKTVLEAVGKIRGSAPIPSEIFKMLETSQGPGDIRDRARMAFFTAYRIIGELEQVNDRRKVVIYVSTGYDFDPFAEGRRSTDRVQGGRFSDATRMLVNQENPYYKMAGVTADGDLHRLLRELTLSANRANASIYTIDPRLLAGVVDAGTYLDQSEWRTYLQKTTSTLRFIAEETGGFAVVNTNDVVGELKKIDAETSDYYVLGFYSSNPDPLKRTRALEITVNRPDVTVAARRGYSLRETGKPPTPPALKPLKPKK